MAFEGIITSDMKALFNDAIDALLEDTALTVPCKLVFDSTKFTLCENCTYDAINKRSSGVYKTGGPASFTQGMCPSCHGVGRTTNGTSVTQYMIVIFDSSKFSSDVPVNVINQSCQTMSKVETLTNLKRCDHAIMDSDMEGLTKNIYKRNGEPQPLGWGDNAYILTTWTRTSASAP